MPLNEAAQNLAHAVALAYHEGTGAPRVTAKGSGPIAGEIIRRAREAGIYVHESRMNWSALLDAGRSRPAYPAQAVYRAQYCGIACLAVSPGAD